MLPAVCKGPSGVRVTTAPLCAPKPFRRATHMVNMTFSWLTKGLLGDELKSRTTFMKLQHSILNGSDLYLLNPCKLKSYVKP